MSMNRLWVLGAVLLIGVVVVLGWALGISPKLSEASAAKAEQESVETQNTAFEVQLGELKNQYESIGDLRKELADLRQAVPDRANMPAFVGQLDEIARTHEVTLSAIEVSEATPYDPLLAAAPVPPDAPPAEGVAGDSAAAADPVPVPTGETPVAAPPVSELITAENFVAVPISVTVEGSYDNVLDFIDGLQTGKRLVMVSGFTTAAVGNSESVKATISALVYVLIDPNAATPATEATAAG